MMYIKFTKEKGEYRISISGVPTRGSNKILRKYIERINENIVSLPQFVKT